jgi:hypothetical protein
MTTTVADLPTPGYTSVLADYYFSKLNVKPVILTKEDNLKEEEQGMLAELILLLTSRPSCSFGLDPCGTAVSIRTQAQQVYFDGPASDNFGTGLVLSPWPLLALALLSVLAYAIAPISSGGHRNLAVTMALFMVENIGPNRLLGCTLD